MNYLPEFRCVETFKRKGRINSRVMVKPFVTGLIRLAETLREQYRQKQRKECEDFHDRHVQVGTPLYYHLHFLIIPPYSSLNPNFLPVSTFPFFPSSHIPTLSLTGVEGH